MAPQLLHFTHALMYFNSAYLAQALATRPTKNDLSLAYAFTLACRFNKELVFFHQTFQPHCCTYKVSVDVFYCIVTIEEEHRSVVEMFGEKRQVFC